ncbi:MAG: NAD(P)H-quinone oxidoreductase [Egibacteraceae bacterium]|jgi:putative PIG3 family NAD(P)H quinone oxidoreductase
MRAVVAPDPGGRKALRVVERPDPEPGPGELRLRVAAAGVNRADILQRKGRYPPPPGASDVLGLEAAGTVDAIGAGVTGWAAGDRACAVLAGGGYAELVVVPAAVAMPWPGGIDAVGAGAVAEVFTTAHDNLFTRAGLRSGETLLVHGGSSGVGTAAIQLAVRAGVEVLVTASTADKLAACADLGAAVGIDYTTQDFVEAVRDHTAGHGVDVVLDVVGGPYLDRNLRALASEGRLVVIGLQGGAKAELDMGWLLTRRLKVMASTLRARSTDEKAQLARRMEAEVWPGFAEGALRPVIHATYPLADAADAHEVMESGTHIGKLVLLP